MAFLGSVLLAWGADITCLHTSGYDSGNNVAGNSKRCIDRNHRHRRNRKHRSSPARPRIGKGNRRLRRCVTRPCVDPRRIAVHLHVSLAVACMHMPFCMHVVCGFVWLQCYRSGGCSASRMYAVVRAVELTQRSSSRMRDLPMHCDPCASLQSCTRAIPR
jgi:hypothetical protein